MKLKYKIFVQWNTKFSLLKVLGTLSFRPSANCISSANLVAEIQLERLNERALSTGEPCTCEYVTFVQSFYRGAISLHWYLARNFLTLLHFLISRVLNSIKRRSKIYNKSVGSSWFDLWELISTAEMKSRSWRTGVFQLLVETRVFSRDEISRYRLWLLLLITRELNLTKLRKDLTINLWTAAVPLFETSSIQLRSNADLERTDCSNYC